MKNIKIKNYLSSKSKFQIIPSQVQITNPNFNFSSKQ